MIITELPGMTEAVKASIALRRQTGASFITTAAMPIDQFDQIVGETMTDNGQLFRDSCTKLLPKTPSWCRIPVPRRPVPCLTNGILAGTGGVR